ncbi:MAG: DUF1223 domain-containing protein [Rhodospirillales bacterium]
MLKTARTFALVLALTLIPALLPALAYAGERASDQAAAKAPVQPLAVVELYTSQGCSSCPPADAFMGELVKRPDVLGLTFHIDYWDYIGWKDPFAAPENTERQRRHAKHLKIRSIYTPQMVIQGARDAVGSNRWQVGEAIEKTRHIPTLNVVIKRDKKSDALKVVVPSSKVKDRARIYLFAYDEKHTTTIKRGENGGRSLSYYNVVRSTKKIGIWAGMKLKLFVPIAEMVAAGHTGCAVIVQSRNTGHILGAAYYRFEHTI